MGLTTKECDNAKADGKDRIISDGDGLFLSIRTSGRKQWQFRYRLGGKQKKRLLGDYPAVTIKTARAMRDALRLDLKGGGDPKSSDLSVHQPVTFREIAMEWYENQSAKWSAGHAMRVRSRIEDDLIRPLGNEPISTVSRKDLLAALRAIEDRGAIETAKRVSQYASAIFEFAISEEHIEVNPGHGIHRSLKANPPTKHNPKLSEDQLPEFFGKLADYDSDLTRIGIKLVMHTFVRTGEIVGATEDELDFKRGLWRIPGARMKRGLEHLVPLTPTTTELFEQLIDMHPGGGRLLPISSNTMIFALYRMGYHTRATVHGFRSTASTILNESALFRADVIERQMAHVPNDAIRAAYNAAEYLPERKKMMHWYSEKLDRLERQGLGTGDDDFEDLFGFEADQKEPDLLADLGLS